jgi:hypothetical protein
VVVKVYRKHVQTRKQQKGSNLERFGLFWHHPGKTGLGKSWKLAHADL